jgi:plasmid stabilization system protein ParE
VKLRAVLRRAAAAEFHEAREWYEARRPGLGAEFEARVDAAIEDAATHPDRHPQVHGDIRRLLVRQFPYAVFYVIEPRRLVVLAIFHCARDPAVWKAR